MPFFDLWMRGWSRKIVLAETLASARVAIADSARQLDQRRQYDGPLSLPQLDASPIQFQRALAAVDLFPQWVLALTVAEGLSVDDLAILLDQSPAVIRMGFATGLRQLTLQLAAMQNSGASEWEAPGVMGEVQHA